MIGDRLVWFIFAEQADFDEQGFPGPAQRPHETAGIGARPVPPWVAMTAGASAASSSGKASAIWEGNGT